MGNCDGARAAMLGGVLLLAGCASVPLASYDLNALPASKSGSPVRSQMVIAAPIAVQALDSERILVRTDGNTLAYLAGGQWPERLPAIVQARLVQSFENSHRLARVARPGDRILPDVQLDSEIRAFEFNVAAGEVRVEIAVKLVNDHTGRIVGEQVFSARVTQGSSEPKAVSTALDQALGDVMGQMINWSAKQL